MRKTKPKGERSLADQLYRRAVAIMLMKETRMSYRQVVQLHWDQLVWPNTVLCTRTHNAREARISHQLVDMIKALPYEHDRLVFWGDSPFADVDTFAIRDKNPAFTEQNRTELIRQHYNNRFMVYGHEDLVEANRHKTLRLPKLVW